MVVAPPEMVRPPTWVPEPMVEEAKAERLPRPVTLWEFPVTAPPKVKAGKVRVVPTLLKVPERVPPFDTTSEVVEAVAAAKFVEVALVKTASCAARLVLEAVVAKKFVVVAEVPVALRNVKFWRVVLAVARRFGRVMRPELETLKMVVDALLATRNESVVAVVSVPQRVRRAYGVEVPTATLPPRNCAA